MAMNTVDVFAMMDEDEKRAAERSQTGIFKPVLLQMSVGLKKSRNLTTYGQKIMIRPLWNLDQIIPAYKHELYVNGKYEVNASCAAMKGLPCVHCEGAKSNPKLTAKRMYVLPVYLYWIKEQLVFNGPWMELKRTNESNIEEQISGLRLAELSQMGAFAPVFNSFRATFFGIPDENQMPEDLRKRDYILECHGEGSKKAIDPRKQDMAIMAPHVRSEIPATSEAVIELLLAARLITTNGPSSSNAIGDKAIDGVLQAVQNGKNADEAPEF